jgi:hypothetical protein
VAVQTAATTGQRLSRFLILRALRSFIISAAMLVFGWATAWAIPVGLFDAASLGITQITGPVIPGTIDSFDFRLTSLVSFSLDPFVTGPSSFGYLNVVSGSQWLIQNEPIPLLGALTAESQHFWFAPPSASLQSTAAILNNIPFGSMPTPDSTWSSVAGQSVLAGYGAADPQGEVGGAVPGGPPPPAVAVIEGYLRGGVPDIKQLYNECGPTSTTNSLLWLINKYGIAADKLPKQPNGSLDEQAILTLLAVAMEKHNPGGGAWDPNTPVHDNSRDYPGLQRGSLEAGKIDFIRDYGLPVVVEGGVFDLNAQGASAFGFVKKELEKGQDVEFLIQWPDGGGFHWVTAVGFIDAGTDMKTLIVHDPLKGDGNNYWKLKDDGTFITPNGIASRAVAESPIPEPATLPLFGIGVLGLVGYRWLRPSSQERGFAYAS